MVQSIPVLVMYFDYYVFLQIVFYDFQNKSSLLILFAGPDNVSDYTRKKKVPNEVTKTRTKCDEVYFARQHLLDEKKKKLSRAKQSQTSSDQPG